MLDYPEDTYAVYQEQQDDELIDEYLDFIGLRGIPNVEGSLDEWLFLKDGQLNDRAQAVLRDYVANFGEVD